MLVFKASSKIREACEQYRIRLRISCSLANHGIECGEESEGSTKPTITNRDEKNIEPIESLSTS